MKGEGGEKKTRYAENVPPSEVISKKQSDEKRSLWWWGRKNLKVC